MCECEGENVRRDNFHNILDSKLGWKAQDKKTRKKRVNPNH